MIKKARKTILIIVILLSFLIILFKIIKVQDIIYKKIYKTEYSQFVYKYSQENEIDPLLVFAIIKAESNFKKNVVSTSGAIGLMQLMESTAKDMTNQIQDEIIIPDSLYDAEINIKIGTKYFSQLLKKYDESYMVALAAYNAGIGNVDKWIEEGIISKNGENIENIPYKETNNYVRKIVRDYKIYQDLY